MVTGERPWASFEAKDLGDISLPKPFEMDKEDVFEILDLFEKGKRIPPGWISKLHKVKYPDFFSKPLVDLVANLLEREPEKRFGFSDIVVHDWLKEVDTQKCLSLDKKMIPSWVRKVVAVRKGVNFQGLAFGSNEEEGGLKDDSSFTFSRLEIAYKPLFRSFDDLMRELGNIDKNHPRRKWNETIHLDNQKLFADWDYISPQAVGDELTLLSKNMGLLNY